MNLKSKHGQKLRTLPGNEIWFS